MEVKCVLKLIHNLSLFFLTLLIFVSSCSPGGRGAIVKDGNFVKLNTKHDVEVKCFYNTLLWVKNSVDSMYVPCRIVNQYLSPLDMMRVVVNDKDTVVSDDEGMIVLKLVQDSNKLTIYSIVGYGHYYPLASTLNCNRKNLSSLLIICQTTVE